jgi:hypothetical protein
VTDLLSLAGVGFGLRLYVAGVTVASDSREDAPLCSKFSDDVESGATCPFSISWPALPVIDGRIAVTIVALKYKSASAAQWSKDGSTYVAAPPMLNIILARRSCG